MITDTYVIKNNFNLLNLTTIIIAFVNYEHQWVGSFVFWLSELGPQVRLVQGTKPKTNSIKMNKESDGVPPIFLSKH